MSVFAKQLYYVLEQHKKNFGQLYKIRVEDGGYDGRVISPEKIKRLGLAVSGQRGGSVTLNRYELEAVQNTFHFSPEEIRRLRVALICEAVLRLLLDRIERVKAVQISEGLFHLLFNADDSTFFAQRTLLINDIRTDDTDIYAEITDEQGIQNNLDPIIEIYETALLWLDAASMARKPILRRGYLAMVESLLTDTQELLEYPPASAYGTLQLVEWRQAVMDAIQEMNILKAR